MSGIGCRGSICRCQRYAPRSYSKSGLTHTVTHTRKRADKNNGEDRAYLPQYTERKASKSLKKQQAECPDTLRNQQVAYDKLSSMVTGTVYGEEAVAPYANGRL